MRRLPLALLSLAILAIAVTFLAHEAAAAPPAGVIIGPTVGLNDAGTNTVNITWTATASQTLYAHINTTATGTVKNITTALNASGTSYWFIWNGSMDDGVTKVANGNYWALLSTTATAADYPNYSPNGTYIDIINTPLPTDTGTFANNNTWVTAVTSLDVFNKTTATNLTNVYYTTDNSTPTTTGTFVTANNGSVTFADGTFQVKTLGVDIAGNQQNLSATTRWFVVLQDQVAPTAADNVPAVWQSANVLVVLTGTDSVSGPANCYYTTDGTTPTGSSSSVASGGNFTVSTSGNYTLKYFCKDTAGNSGTVVTGANNVRLDKTVPTTANNFATVLLTNRTIFTGTVTLFFNATETCPGAGSLNCVNQTFYHSWRDGTVEPSTWTVGANTTVNATTSGIFWYRWYSTNLANGAESNTTNTDNVTVGIVHTLTQGWNVFGYPGLNDTKVNVTTIFTQVTGAFDVVWSYDNVNGTWLLYNPASPAVTTLYQVNRTTLFWMNVTAASATLYDTYSPAPVHGAVSIAVGWNAVVLPKNRDATLVSAALTGVSVGAAWQYDNTAKVWNLWNPNNSLANTAFNVRWDMPVIVYATATGVVSW